MLACFQSHHQDLFLSLHSVLMPATHYYISVDYSDIYVLVLSTLALFGLNEEKRLVCREMVLVKLGFGPEICVEHIQGRHLAYLVKLIQYRYV